VDTATPSDGALFFLLAALCVGGFAVLAFVAIRSSKKWMAELLAQARRLGWQKIDSRAQAPAAVAESARSPRSVLLLYHQERQIWLSWHRWTESTTSSDNRSSSSRTHDLTTYFVALPGPFPDLSVVRRTKVGGFLKARRGLGTGDEDFDRSFAVKPPDSEQAVRAITPRLAHALKANEVPEFSVTSNVLSTVHHSPPDWRRLQPHAEQLGRLVHLLT
jgi:hypothetical protein